MNVERLNTIVTEVLADFKQSGVIDALNNLSTLAQQLSSNPGQPQFQEQLSVARREFEAAVSRSRIDEWPATWQETLTELGIRDDLGSALREQVDALFRDNEVTVQTIVSGVSELHDVLSARRGTLQELGRAFEAMNIAAETLGPNEAEIMVMIPRGEVDESLPGLSKEFRELNQIFGCFEELVTGSRPPLKVRSLASSDFGLYLAATPAVVLSIGLAVEKVLDVYMRILDIREKTQSLKDQGVPPEALARLEEHVQTTMQESIGQYVDECMAGRDSARDNELRNELRLSLNAIANRIDHGFNFDVRVGEPEEARAEGDGDVEPEDPGLMATRATVIDISSRLRYVNRAGGMLSLPEPDPNDPTKPATEDDDHQTPA